MIMQSTPPIRLHGAAADCGILFNVLGQISTIPPNAANGQQV